MTENDHIEIRMRVRSRILRLAVLASEEDFAPRELLACCEVLAAVLREHLAVHGVET